jgi:hypothetical protein
MVVPRPTPNARLVGGATLALAGVALKWGLFDQLRAAREGAAVIALATYSLFVAPGFAALGLLLVIFGEARFLTRWIEVESEDRISPCVLWFIVGGMVPGTLLCLWLQSALTELGYQEMGGR